MYRIAIIQFPGSNCESESIRAVRAAGMEAEEFLWNEDYRKLENYDGYFIVGGFSYEDRSRSGIIAALDPIMPVIAAEAKKGKPVLGVCNGAQILVETGLVPGLKDNQVGIALAVNKRVKDGQAFGVGFYNAWVYMALTIDSNRSAFTRHLKPGQPVRLPVAHGEGRFVMPEGLLTEMKNNQQTSFRYCDGDGNFAEEFPANPNGAMWNLAAVINPCGNVMAIMPHPERTPEGQPIFTSMRDYIVNSQNYKLPADQPHLSYSPSPATPDVYQKPKDSLELIVNLIITDNTARTVENTLDKIAIHANIERYTHWEVESDPLPSSETLQQLIATGEILNTNKEYVIDKLLCPRGQCAYLLVRDAPDTIGQQKTQILINRFGLTALRRITKSTLWKISVERGSIETVVDNILRTHILFNPYSQECFRYNPTYALS